ncbi:putative molybdenum carrier protein [Thiomicrorhabdus sp.]|uniref:putative molybdenum carrier protein n=1 Tax=Thiomicrorhabdus sp. TaxID=2039724 RepID=UPI002AA8B58F|nr:putative molybdenum carrier protein [Thiomicrorhabdus sp.]
MKIISGGQTGVDRAALDFGLLHQIEIGGYCPKGKIAEDGVIPSKYGLTELSSQNYSQRTLKNVINSDATLIIYFDKLSGGTLNTRDFCRQEDKPVLLIDASQKTPNYWGQKAKEFVSNYHVNTLNVAGPRSSKCSLCYEYTMRLLGQFL